MDEASRAKLWKKYQETKSSEVREQIIIEYAPLVKIVAGKLSMYLGYNVEFDDLVGYGVFGLIDAIDKFDCTKDVKFETYASLRIRGAILDQIRKMDWIPRTLRQKQKKMEAAIQAIEARTNRTAQNDEIAIELGITEEELLNWQGQMKITSVVSLDEYVEQGSEPNIRGGSGIARFEQPETVVEVKELKVLLKESLDKLTEKERKVVLLYYYEELTLKEISLVLEVSESRVSQLHTRALQKMKAILGDEFSVLMKG